MTRPHGRAPSPRQLRVGEEIRHVLAAILGRGDLRDPELCEVPITVTEIRASPDLRVATVFVTPLGGGEEEAVVKALRRAAPFLRHEVARAVRLKFAPELRFEADRSFEAAGRIEAALRRVEGTPPASARTRGARRRRGG